MTMFECKRCNYITYKKGNYTAHLNTQKHLMSPEIANEKCMEIPNKIMVDKYSCEKYSCDKCSRQYNTYNSYWYHITKSRCSKQKDQIQLLQETIKDLMKQNENNNIINNTINGNVQNNTFNLNVFLNEHCKDALNITDYINNIQLQLEDLTTTARLGYTEGITKIISDRVKECGIYNRPFHCTDKKREIVYVKDNDIWEKEQSDKPKMKKMITNVIHKNLQQLAKWHEKFPECQDGESQKGNDFLHMMIEANGGDEREKKEEVILKNILKEVIVEK